MPTSLPKTKSESLSDGNSVKSEEDEVLEVVPPTEPVMPFFSLPDTPTITAVEATTSGAMTAPSGSIARSGNGYQTNGKGYQSASKGYQSASKGYQSASKGYQSSGYGYRTSGNGYQGSNVCQDIAKNRLVGDSRGDGIVPSSAVISCFVGDQRQSNDKNLSRCSGGNSSPVPDGGREFVFPAVESVTDENRSHQEQASE